MIRSRRSLAGIALLIAAAVTRLSGLGGRFFHHDESVHAWMAHEIVRGAGYHYDPVYHGPLLYHLEALVFNLLGTGDFQARLVPAAFGIALVGLLSYMLAPRLGRGAASIAGALAVVSPSLTYYSRFDSHDILIAVFTVAMVAAPFDFERTGLIWFAGVAALAIATKLNAYFVLGTLGLYAVARLAYGRLRHRPLPMLTFCRSHLSYVWLAAGVAALVVSLLSITTGVFYARTAGLSLGRAILTTTDSMLLGGFKYWWSAHETGRLGGPFHFYLPILFIYEPLVFLGAPAALVFYMQRRRWFAVTLVTLLAAEWLLVFHVGAVRSLLTAMAGIQGWHVLLASSLLLAGGWAVVSLWNTEREFLACWVFVAVLQFLLYSYANEKVPWLVVHILLPWLIVVSACVADAWRIARSTTVRSALLVLVIVAEVFTARTSWIVNTRNRSNVAEPLVQVDFHRDVADLVRQMTGERRPSGEGPLIATESTMQWPFGWYFRDLRVNYAFARAAPDAATDVFIAEDQDVPSLGNQYTRSRLHYYQWSTWIENVNDGDVAGLLRFMLRHDRWGHDDGTWFLVWTRKDLWR